MKESKKEERKSINKLQLKGLWWCV